MTSLIDMQRLFWMLPMLGGCYLTGSDLADMRNRLAAGDGTDNTTETLAVACRLGGQEPTTRCWLR